MCLGTHRQLSITPSLPPHTPAFSPAQLGEPQRPGVGGWPATTSFVSLPLLRGSLQPPHSLPRPGLATQTVGSSPHTPGRAARLLSFKFRFFSCSHLTPAFSISAGRRESKPCSFLQLITEILSDPGHRRDPPCPISHCQALAAMETSRLQAQGSLQGLGLSGPPDTRRNQKSLTRSHRAIA